MEPYILVGPQQTHRAFQEDRVYLNKTQKLQRVNSKGWLYPYDQGDPNWPNTPENNPELQENHAFSVHKVLAKDWAIIMCEETNQRSRENRYYLIDTKDLRLKDQELRTGESLNLPEDMEGVARIGDPRTWATYPGDIVCTIDGCRAFEADEYGAASDIVNLIDQIGRAHV